MGTLPSRDEFPLGEADFERLAGLIETAESRIKALDDLRSQMAYLRCFLHLRMSELTARANKAYQDGYRIPPIPDLAPTSEKWMWNGEDFLALWQSLEKVLYQDVVLSDNYSREDFMWHIGEMEQFFQQIEEQFLQTRKAIWKQDKLGDQLRPLIAHGKLAIPRRYAPNHPVVLLLEPHARSQQNLDSSPSILSGEWDGGHQMVRLEWRPSPRWDIQHYEVRQCSDRQYDPFFERTVWMGSDAGALVTAWFGPGATMLFRLYAVLASHQAFGSNVVSVTRPFP